MFRVGNGKKYLLRIRKSKHKYVASTDMISVEVIAFVLNIKSNKNNNNGKYERKRRNVIRIKRSAQGGRARVRRFMEDKIPNNNIP